MLHAIADGGNVEAFLHPSLSFRGDSGDELDRDGILERLATRLDRSHGHRLVIADAMAKRNVVIASWQWQAPDGRTIESGTWFLSFDRDGLVTEWAEIAAEGAAGGA